MVIIDFKFLVLFLKLNFLILEFLDNSLNLSL